MIPRNSNAFLKDIKLERNKNKRPSSRSQQSELIVIQDSDASEEEHELSLRNIENSSTKQMHHPSVTVKIAKLRNKSQGKSKAENRKNHQVPLQKLTDVKHQQGQQAIESKVEARHTGNSIASQPPVRAKSQRIIQQRKDNWKSAIRELSRSNLTKQERRRLTRLILQSEQTEQKRFHLPEENKVTINSVIPTLEQDESNSSSDEFYIPRQPAPFRRKDRPVSPTPSDSLENPTADFLTSHCWVCHKRVKEVDGKPCLYAMHLHPTLMVPCCLICCDEIQAIDTPEDQDDLEFCMGCAREDSLLLCDICPKGFCETCTAQAWGGGALGLQQVERLIKDNNRSWACLTCNPPKPLTLLQILDAKNEGESEIEEDIEDVAARLVVKLDAIEDDLESCDKLLEEDNLTRLKEEIREELIESIPVGNELDEKVEEDLELWKVEHLEHMIRVQDYKADILERLNGCGISDDQYYKYRAERNPKVVSTDEYNSEWRRNADLEIDRRVLEEQKMPSFLKDNIQDEAGDSDEEEKRALAEVEDLCTSLEPEVWETEDLIKTRRQWKSQHFESREFIEKKQQLYLERDDVYLKNIGSQVTKIDRESDEKAAKEEFSFVSLASKEGVMVRRDAIHALQTRVGIKQEASSSNPMSSVSKLNDDSKKQARSKEDVKDKRSKSLISDKSTSDNQRINSESITITPPSQSKQEVDYSKSNDDDSFWGSCVELSSVDQNSGARRVRLANAIASHLKPHQVEGIKFMWRNTCSDLPMIQTREEMLLEKDVGGCILAHMMGLGKSLQVVALVHTLLHHPSLRPPKAVNSRPFIRNILLIVPVNTIANWTNEFDKWTGKLKHSVRYFDYSSVQIASRPKILQDWSDLGGIFLIGSDAFTRLAKMDSMNKLFHDPGPDMVILDEAHTLLKTQYSEVSKMLGPLRTKRRITLTGTPFVNNLREYFKLLDWCRPGVLGTFENFDRTFIQNIMAGLSSDSTPQQVADQVRTSKLLFSTMSPFMQRRGISFLTRDLPPSQTAVLYIRQSKLQSRLYRSFETYVKSLQSHEKLSFISHYQMLRPLHNHPYCLLQQSMNKSCERKGNLDSLYSGPTIEKRMLETERFDVKSITSEPKLHTNQSAQGSHDSNAFAYDKPQGRKHYQWMEKVISKLDESSVSSVKHGHKIFLLLQILAISESMGDKVVVFTQCLKTLDLIEKVLTSSNWARYCFGQEKNISLSNWKKGTDYVRIDGSVHASERGVLISNFNEELGGVKAFLLSIEAGGMGINLVAANRVVIFDNHWNPTISSQAFHRCYRFGQQKPVYGYRFITQGSMEEKIFKRSVTKSGVAARVIDQQFPERNFTDRELAEIQALDTWAQCDRCLQWRLLFFSDEEGLPDKWYCELNNDPLNNACKIPERSQLWYEQNRSRIADMTEKKKVGETSTYREVGGDTLGNAESDASKIELVKKDALLLAMGVLDLFSSKTVNVGQNGKTTPISVISDIQFQEMLQTESNDLAIEALESKDDEASQASKSAVRKDGVEEHSAIQTTNKADLDSASKNAVKQDFASTPLECKDAIVMRDGATAKTASASRQSSSKHRSPSSSDISPLSKADICESHVNAEKAISQKESILKANSDVQNKKKDSPKVSGSSKKTFSNLQQERRNKVLSMSVLKETFVKPESKLIHDKLSPLKQRFVDVQGKMSASSTINKRNATINDAIPRKKPKAITNSGQPTLLVTKNQNQKKKKGLVSEVIDLMCSDEEIE